MMKNRMTFCGKRGSAGQLFSCLFLLSVIIASCTEAFAKDPNKELKERVVGDYKLRDVRETASGFHLGEDGSYKFFLIYGSVDESDVGKWKIEGTSVVLHSTASSVDPSIELVRSSKEAFSGARVSFEGDAASIAPFCTRIALHSKGQALQEDEINDNYMQWKSDVTPVQKISVAFFGAMRSYRTFEFEPRFQDHNNFVFRVTLGNYGFVRFDGTHLAPDQGDLILEMPNTSEPFRYVRVKSAP